MSAQASVRSYLGIAKESAEGTAVAPSKFIPVALGKLKATDIIAPLLDEGVRGANAKEYNYIQGRKHSEIEWGGPVFPDTLPWAIGGVLGDITTTGSGPYTHSIALENSTATGASSANPQPTTLTLTDFYAANVRSYPGCKVHDFTLNFSAEGLLEYDAKATGWASSVPSTPSPTWDNTILPVPVWAATVTLGGTTVSNVVEGMISMARPVTPIFGIANTQNPYTVFSGPLEVKGQLKFVMEDDTQLTAFLSQDSANLPALVVNWSQGSGASATQIQATLSKRAYTTAVIDRGKDYVEIVVDIIGMANSTDVGSSAGFSPIKWAIKNAISTNIYQ